MSVNTLFQCIWLCVWVSSYSYEEQVARDSLEACYVPGRWRKVCWCRGWVCTSRETQGSCPHVCTVVYETYTWFFFMAFSHLRSLFYFEKQLVLKVHENKNKIIYWGHSGSIFAILAVSLLSVIMNPLLVFSTLKVRCWRVSLQIWPKLH